MVGPRLPHTTRATVWPVWAANSGSSGAAMRTGSACCRLIRAKLQRQRPERVVPAGAVLLHQADVAKAHQVRMRLGRRHAGVGRQVFQRHRAAVVGQRVQQAPADFDTLDAAPASPGVNST